MTQPTTIPAAGSTASDTLRSPPCGGADCDHADQREEWFPEQVGKLRSLGAEAERSESDGDPEDRRDQHRAEGTANGANRGWNLDHRGERDPDHDAEQYARCGDPRSRSAGVRQLGQNEYE